MSSKPKSPAAAAAHSIADDLEQRLAPFATAPKKRRATAKSAAAKAAAGSRSHAPLPVEASDEDDARRVLHALAGQAADLRATMVADLERLMGIASAPAVVPPGDEDDDAAGKAKTSPATGPASRRKPKASGAEKKP